MACPAVRPHFFGACPKKRCRAAKEKRLFYPGGSTIRVSAPASVGVTFLARLWGGLVLVWALYVCAVTLGGGSLPCPAVRPHFFGACPKKRGRAAKEKRLFYPGGSTIRGALLPRWAGLIFARLGEGLVLVCGFIRVRRFLGKKLPPPTASSTPFLCSCAKKRGGAPKKRAYGCRHGSCSVPPASPTDSKPQHPRRLRQADLSARSTPLPKSGEDE